MKRYLSVFLITCILVACKSGKQGQTTELEFSFDYFDMGWGGGFTGQYEEFRLHKHGKVEQKNFEDGTFQHIGNLYLAEGQSIFLDLDALKPWEIDLNKPGDITQYIIVYKQERSHKITWAGHDGEGPDGLQAFFANTRRTVRELR